MFIINANIVKHSPPSITPVHQTTLQIGAVKVFLPSVNKYKTISQYRITYTLCGGLNRLQVYVTEIKEKQIFKRIKVANMSTF